MKGTAKHTGLFFGATIKAETLHTAINIKEVTESSFKRPFVISPLFYAIKGLDTRAAFGILEVEQGTRNRGELMP
jgi:hypothetical protein